MSKKTSQEITQGFLRAMDILINNRFEKAKFDKTIPAKVIRCVDKKNGIYRVKHQDATYNVTAGTTDTEYKEGDEVYVLVPEGNMSNEKKIVSEVVAATTTHTVKDTDALANYQNIGENIVNTGGQEFGLCSYKWADETQTVHDYKTLYEHEKESLISLDNDMFTKILEEEGCDHFGIEATFRTNLKAEQRDRGNYGLKVYLIYETDSGEEQKHEFIIDANIMIGNPYLFVDGSIQNVIYELPQGKFKRVDSIIFFSDNFVRKNTEIEDLDIFVKNIKIHGMAQTNAPYFNTYTLELNFSTGNVLSKDNPSTIVSPTVLYHGENTDNSNFEFYWFRANSEITSSHENFNRMGGATWECLNPSKETPIEGSEDKKKIWISQENFFIERHETYVAQQTKYKCVIKLDNGSILEKIFYIADNDATHTITLNATEKSFKNSAGCATITCDVVDLIENDTINFENLIYCWHKVNSAGVPVKLNDPDDVTNGEGTALSEDVLNYLIQAFINRFKDFIQNGIQNKYFNYETYFGKFNVSNEDALKDFNSLIKNEVYTKYLENVLKNLLDIDSSTTLSEASVSYQDILTQLIDIDERYYITYIFENVYHELPARVFSGSVDYGCTVWAKDKDGNRVYLGTANLALTNTIDSSASSATLNIIGGDQVFKYDIMGRSPILKTNENPQPQIVQSLTFNLFDDKGVQIDSGKIYDGPGSIVSGWEWQVPANNTFIKLSEELGSTLSEDGNFYIIKNLKELPFSLVSTYSNSYSNNKIRLNVNYQGTIVRAYTNFIFTKDGSNGTNGTEYVCKVSPNIDSGLEEYPTLIFDTVNGNSKLNYIPNEEGKWFKAELWRNSEMVTVEEDEDLSVSWKILTNKYQYQDGDTIKIRDTADYLYYNYDKDADIFIATPDNYDTLEHPSLITQAEIKYTVKMDNAVLVDGTTITDSKVNTQTQTIYGALPLSTILLYDNSYKVQIDPASGFNQVLFDADGKRPSYSNKDFKVQVFSNENLNDNIADSFTFEFEAYGFSNLLQVKASDEEIGTCSVKVKEGYNGYDTNIGLKCSIKAKTVNEEGIESFVLIGVIYHPIYFMLNRYGLSALNGWNGNSIEVNDQGTVLLAPQVGAGYKENDNSFTGMIMGTMRESIDETAGKSLKDKTGLLGFKAGKQSMFLDAETGRAEFGFAGSGQIVLDPGYSETDNGYNFNPNARIYGGAYVEGNAETGQGLLIDLTTPEIKFGNGKFSVDKDGLLSATGAKITGHITAESLTIIRGEGENQKEQTFDEALAGAGGDAANNVVTAAITEFEKKVAENLSGGDKTTLASDYIISPNIGGGYLYISDGSSYGYEVRIDPSNKRKWMPTHSNSQYGTYIFQIVKKNRNANSEDVVMGVTNTGNAFFKGDITADNITATNSGNIAGWTINATTFQQTSTYGNKSYPTILGSNGDYILTAGSSTPSSAPFKVRKDGVLEATGANITGEITATSGKIGNFKIGTALHTEGYITSFNDTKYSSVGNDDSTGNDSDANAVEGVYIGTDGIRLGANFKIYPTGSLAAGKRIYLPAGRALRALKADAKSVSYADSIALIWNSTSTSTSNRHGTDPYKNRVIVNGSNSGISSTDIRAGAKNSSTGCLGAIYLKCNGQSVDTGDHSIVFFRASSPDEPFFMPLSNKVINLGGNTHRWNTGYFNNIQTETSASVDSDKKLKKDIQLLDYKYIQMFDLLEPVSYKLINGTSGRTHIGFIAQDVENAMNQVGLTSLDFAGLCKDKDEDNQDIYSLRYGEFISINTAKIKQLEQKIKEQQAQIDLLLSKLDS